jgi:predicted AAA+ superfamily ATPase
LLKEPKLYLWDWSLVDDEGHRHENLVASHLLKAVHFWTDRGFGEYGLYYLIFSRQKKASCINRKLDGETLTLETFKELIS